MSTPPKAVVQVQNVLGVTPSKRVLLVEGPNDKKVYSAWLSKLAHPGLYSAKVDVLDVGGKQKIIEALEWFRNNGNPPQVFGIRDRDEWDAATISARTTALPQLRVIPERHCLDNYFCDPDELELGLLKENAGYGSQLPAFRAFLEQALSDWTDHWALLTTTDRLNGQMRAALFPGTIARNVPILADSVIQTHFNVWAGLVDATQLFLSFDRLRIQARAAAQGVRFRSHLWGKRFFEDVVYPQPNGLQRFRHKPLDDWRLDLAKHAPAVPADIAAILTPLLQ